MLPRSRQLRLVTDKRGEMTSVRRTPLQIITLAGILSILLPGLQAQYLGLNLRGDAGVKSGSQPGPGVYLIAPLYYRSDYDGLRNANGDNLLPNLNLDIDVLAVPVLSVVTKAKILGATYGFTVVPLFMNQRLAVADTRFQGSLGMGFGDSYIQPINLGWRTKRADVLAAYGLYLPTGQGDRSLDMWAHEIVLGSTVYLDEGKNWHVAGTGSYEIHQNKRGIDLRVGDILTVEGGVGRSFIKGAASAGLAYVAQWKVTDVAEAISRAGCRKARTGLTDSDRI
jgi:hypothetical protein